MPTFRFWKPYGVLCQFTDPEGRPTLADYVNEPSIYAAGRLDFDSEGLLILTSDGALNARLTSPKFAHEKTYWVQVEGIPSEAQLQELRTGINLKDGRTRPAKARLFDQAPKLPERPVPIRFRANIPTSWIELKITEGKNRQVRRMTAAVGLPCLRLVRWAVGPIDLENLCPGELSELTIVESGFFPKRN